ncbi:Phytanoyl-CoA dioxygenase (PhyH) [Bradyrhizobium lablabi]|uniref:Phytanoyl-CoA dioxygenase (PhyH) n=1 Tax=Bradyrhizobium lablabi TaxID=722472 RepID=A0A1M7BGB4_9BRAD|nr:phytanoyl-CoA dioxygenase family protein [Bradyrhizobium lablabi]SHL53997.1 Phytanoyl-CoA dioxygenase (PhyH) [Bradyrhizobium lablabi]
MLAMLKRPYPLVDHNGVLGHLSTDDVDAIGADLSLRGYHVFMQRLSDDLCDRLLEFALAAPCARRQMDGEATTESAAARYPREKPDAVLYDFREQDLINNGLIQNLMADRSIIAVAQNYLSAQPIVDVVAMWWSAASELPDKQAAQYWHFDMDRIKWLKFFVYLTDVGPENGPHSFVEGSHRRGGISKSLLQKGYSRLTDEEVSANYSPDKFIEFTAPRGTVIAEDTRGLHKGKHVTKRDRLVLQLQFSNSLFGGDYPKCTIRNPSSPQLVEMMANYPRLYSHYT